MQTNVRLDFNSKGAWHAECHGSLSQDPPVDAVKVMVSLHLVIALSAIVPATKGQACFDISNEPGRGAMQRCSSRTKDIASPTEVTPTSFFRV